MFWQLQGGNSNVYFGYWREVTWVCFLPITGRLFDWLVFYAAFNIQSYHSDSSPIHVFPRFTSSGLGLWSFLLMDTPTKKPQRVQFGLNLGFPGEKSCTLPLSHVEPAVTWMCFTITGRKLGVFKGLWWYQCWLFLFEEMVQDTQSDSAIFKWWNTAGI